MKTYMPTSVNRLPEGSPMREWEFDLLTQVYEDVGLDLRTAQDAARADLMALYTAPCRGD